MYRRSAVIFLVLNMIAPVIHSKESGWNVSYIGEQIVVENDKLYTEFARKIAWTIRNMAYLGTKVIVPAGANGTVVNTKSKSWVGTGHGQEIVKQLDILLNGVKMEEFEENQDQAVREVRLIKQSNLGPLDLVAEIIFPESGDRIIEKHTYTVLEDFGKDFNFMYAFMHTNNKALKHWLAILDGGKELAGVSGPQDKKMTLEQDVKAVIFYGEESKTGVTYVYPKVYEGADTFRNSIWNHKNKLYFRPEVKSMGYKTGDRFTYLIKVIPFRAAPEEWRKKGREMAQQDEF